MAITGGIRRGRLEKNSASWRGGLKRIRITRRIRYACLGTMHNTLLNSRSHLNRCFPTAL